VLGAISFIGNDSGTKNVNSLLDVALEAAVTQTAPSLHGFVQTFVALCKP
jgi:hypothetical protein